MKPVQVETSDMKVVGVILAGGSGQRFGGVVPKQFSKLAGRLVIEHTVDVFERAPDIDEVVVVAKSDFIELVWDLAKKNKWLKLKKVVSGGADRFDSTFSALLSLSGYPGGTKVLFHDAVRPLLKGSIIARCVDALDAHAAVDVVIPSSDTLVSVHDSGCIAAIPSRRYMRRGQTPQAFLLSTINDAYKKATEQGRRDFTCDCGVVHAMLPGVDIATVEGDDGNIKITTLFDLFMAEKLIQSTGVVLPAGADALERLKGKQIVIFGGGSGIGKAVQRLAVEHGALVHVASRSLNGVDVSEPAQVEEYLDRVALGGQPIDAVINTAGILIKKPFTSMSAEEVNHLVRTNLVGAMNVAYAAKRHLEKSKGVLINFTSSSYTRGRAYYAVYSATKCAVVNLTQALAEEWADDHIRVNCINPERTLTPMRERNFGMEDPSTLLRPEAVAHSALATVVSDFTGMIVDVKTSLPND